MALIKYRPYNNVDVFDRGLSRFFDSLFDTSGFERSTGYSYTPKADVIENENKYLIHLEAPGLGKGDIEVNLENNILTIKGERKNEVREEKNNYLYQELTYGKFTKTFTLPDGVEADKIDAKLENGILELQVPKAEKQKRKEIAVKIK